MMKKQNSYLCYRKRLEKLFPTQKDGKVILKMPRLFFTLQKR